MRGHRWGLSLGTRSELNTSIQPVVFHSSFKQVSTLVNLAASLLAAYTVDDKRR